MTTALHLSEAAFQRQIVELAELQGWHVWFDPPPLPCRNCGAVTVDPRRRGYPDLEILRGAVMLRLELKSEKGRARDEQKAYIGRLKLVQQVYADIVRPADFDSVADVLKARALW